MKSAAFGTAVIILLLGCLLGWNASRAHAAHGDIRTTHGRLRGYRRARLRNGVYAIGLAIAILLLIRAAAH